jgi:TPP-dependent indolepyruvate ferredoxin oxidoreductase alpha subunit
MSYTLPCGARLIEPQLEADSERRETWHEQDPAVSRRREQAERYPTRRYTPHKSRASVARRQRQRAVAAAVRSERLSAPARLDTGIALAGVAADTFVGALVVHGVNAAYVLSLAAAAGLFVAALILALLG